MPQMVAIALLLCLALPGTAPAQDWKLVWADEFDKPGLPDDSKWGYETGFVRNNEKQYYTKARPENARVENGELIITARKEAYQDAQYTSASLHTKGKAQWNRGRIEVRAKLPAGKGMWPAIWLLGTNISQVGWPACGEIDIMEFVGYDPKTIYANVHCKKYNHSVGNNKGASIEAKNPTEAYHLYAIEWTGDKIDFFFDETKYFTYQNEGTGFDAWPFDEPHYLILNAAIGGSWGGREGIDDSIFPQEYHIDYVRVYEQTTASAETH